MSSIIVIQQTDAVHLITDGAYYDHNGVITDIRSKVIHLPHSNCAFAMRGASWPRAALTFPLQFADSLDDVVDMLPNLMRAMVSTFDNMYGPDASPLDRNFEVTVAGWSDRLQRMVAGVASTWEPRDPNDVTEISYLNGYECCVPWVPGQGYTAPAIDIQAVLGRAIDTQGDIDAIDPEQDGFKIHLAQRREGGVYGGKGAYLIGGFAELTTVRRDGISRRILREWPDQVGHKIIPEGAAPLEMLQAALDAANAWREAKRVALEEVADRLDEAA